MKIIDLALKDLLRNLRSVFLLVMMFVIPLLITGLIYFAFGSSGDELTIQPTRLMVVNLDQPDSSGFDFSKEILEVLKSKDLKDLVILSEKPDEISAVSAIQANEADVALIIPVDFSDTLLTATGQSELKLLNDPALTLQPKVVRAIIENIVNGFNGSRVAISVATDQFEQKGINLENDSIETIVSGYTSFLQKSTGTESGDGYLQVRAPATNIPAQSQMQTIMTGIMGAQLIFFVFFTGATFAQSLLKENEEKTLARLFTTPTTMTQILAAKMIGAMLMILIQITVLLIVSRFVFKFDWGAMPPLTLTVLATDLAAASFGIMVMSLVKSTQQAGFVVGGVMTATSMLGIFPIMMQSTIPALNTASLFTPQGWAMNALKLTIAGASLSRLALPLIVLLGASAVFFTIGVFLFRRRFA